MINLLPQDVKKQYRAARMNVIIVRYNILLICAAAFLAVAICVAYFYLSSTESMAKQTIADNDGKAASFSTVKTQADAFTSQLSDAKTLMDSQISYSKALLGIAAAMPDGTSLSTLELNDKSFGAPIELTFNVRDESTARQLLTRLNSSSVTSNATRGDITFNTSGAYAFSMKVTLTLAKEQPQ